VKERVKGAFLVLYYQLRLGLALERWRLIMADETVLVIEADVPGKEDLSESL